MPFICRECGEITAHLPNQGDNLTHWKKTTVETFTVLGKRYQTLVTSPCGMWRAFDKALDD